MKDNLDLLLYDGIIDEVISRLKSGKEADVWLVAHEGAVVAAKVYKDRSTRSFKNNAGYTEGRKVRNSRTQRAIDKGSRFGQAQAEEAWKSAEADTLYRLHAAEVRVPTPVMFYEGVLLMELVLGADGQPAPRLIEMAFTPEEAEACYLDLRAQMIKILCCDLIHGDLSPYNVLLGAAGPTIIDFPQTVAAAANNQAASFFKRDFENIRGFFAGFNRGLSKYRTDVHEIWSAYEQRELTPEFVPTGTWTPPRTEALSGAAMSELLQDLQEDEREARRRGLGAGRGGRRPSGGHDSGPSGGADGSDGFTTPAPAAVGPGYRREFIPTPRRPAGRRPDRPHDESPHDGARSPGQRGEHRQGRQRSSHSAGGGPADLEGGRPPRGRRGPAQGARGSRDGQGLPSDGRAPRGGHPAAASGGADGRQQRRRQAASGAERGSGSPPQSRPPRDAFTSREGASSGDGERPRDDRPRRRRRSRADARPR